MRERRRSLPVGRVRERKSGLFHRPTKQFGESKICDLDVAPAENDKWTIRYYLDDDNGFPGDLIAEFIEVYLHRSNDPESLRRMLAARGLGSAWRVWFEQMLQKAEPVPTPLGWEGFRTFTVDRKVPESDTITSFYLRSSCSPSLTPDR